MELIAVFWSALFGLVIGSFLNVVIYRTPRGESLMGRSHCPGCNYQIAPYDNIPVFSWLALKGRCRRCKQTISPQYPLVEAATAVSFGLIVWQFGASPVSFLLIFFAASSIALFMIDLQTLRLPDAIVIPTTVVLAGGFALLSIYDKDLDRFFVAALGAGLLTLFYFVIWIATLGRGLGFGDVKLAPSLGLTMGYFGLGAVLSGTAVAWLLGAIIGVFAIVVGKAKRGKPIPFGPFLIIGCWVGVFFGADMFDGYWSFMQSV